MNPLQLSWWPTKLKEGSELGAEGLGCNGHSEGQFLIYFFQHSHMPEPLGCVLYCTPYIRVTLGHPAIDKQNHPSGPTEKLLESNPVSFARKQFNSAFTLYQRLSLPSVNLFCVALFSLVGSTILDTDMLLPDWIISKSFLSVNASIGVFYIPNLPPKLGTERLKSVL
jgi:hypothetical protein